MYPNTPGKRSVMICVNHGLFQICCLCLELITGINRIPSLLFSEIASEIMKSPGQSEVIDSGMYINCVTK